MPRCRDLPALAVFFSCLSACAMTGGADAPGAESSVAATATGKNLLPTPTAPLDLSAPNGADITLEELLARLSKITNVTFSAGGNAGDRLKKTTVSLSQDKRFAIPEVYAGAESILQQNGFALALLEGGSAPLVGVYTNFGPNQTPPATRIETERLDECRAHPAFLFTLVLTLPHTDVRSLGNSLRILSPDTQSGGVIPVGTTNSVILNGTGRQVAELAGLLRTIDDAAAVKKAEPPNQQ